MKDKDSYFRGACSQCNCPEYANAGKIKCSDCGCPATRHRLVHSGLGNILDSSKSIAKSALAWLEPKKEPEVKSGYFSRLIPTFSMPSLSLSFPSFFYRKPAVPEPDAFEKLVHRLMADRDAWMAQLPILSQKFPLADSKSPILLEFQRRLHYGISTLAALSVLGILGFRADYLHSPFLGTLYLWVIVSLVIGSSFAQYNYKNAKSNQKKTLSAILLCMNLLSLGSYGLIYLGLTPKLTGPLGIPVQSARFVELLVSIPTWIHIFYNLCGEKATPQRLIRTTQLYLVIFLVASGLLTPYCEWAGAIGISIFLSHIHDVIDLFVNASQDGSKKALIDKESIEMIQSVVLFSWAAIPCTWVLSAIGAFGYPESEFFYSLADVGSKAVLTVIVTSGQMA